MKRENIMSVIGYSVLAAVLYTLTAIYFINSARFQDTWILYVGNVLFGVAVSLFMLRHIAVRKEGGSTASMAMVGHVVVIIGVVLSCLLAFVALAVFIPDIFSSGKADTVLENSPSWQRGGKTDGLVMQVFMDAVVGNVAAGSFVSLMFAYTAKVNQTRDKESKFLKE
jgi:heme/copper-type cytochrome/quinol oxidase subunit 4